MKIVRRRNPLIHLLDLEVNTEHKHTNCKQLYVLRYNSCSNFFNKPLSMVQYAAVPGKELL